jgi:hypothetical protein
MGRVRFDVHQRRQERIVRHEKLGRTQVLPHKPFYAVNLLVDEVKARLIQADFLDMEATNREEQEGTDSEASMLFARDLPLDKRAWYNFFDFIDADRKPFDVNPRVLITDLADCPHIFWTKRVKAFAISSGYREQQVWARRESYLLHVGSAGSGTDANGDCAAADCPAGARVAAFAREWRRGRGKGGGAEQAALVAQAHYAVVGARAPRD